MGFFKKFTKPFTNIGKAVVSIAKNPVKAVTSGTLTNVLLTGGLNLAVPKLNKALSPVTSFLTNPAKALPLAASVLTGNPALALSAFVPQTQGATPMGFNIGGLLGSVSGILGGNQNPYFQTVSSAASLASNFFPQPSGNIYTVAQNQQRPGPPLQPMPRAPMQMRLRAGGLSGAVLSILATVASQLGRKSISLSGAMSIIRKMGKFLMEPAAIAVALGIGVSELADLITASSMRKHRHMNPANGKALRRAARRIKSFHRMCGTIDLLKSRGRRAPSRSGCGTCRKNPCRC